MCPPFWSNRISALLRGRPSVPVTFPSREEVCADSVAEQASAPVNRRLATKHRKVTNQHCSNVEDAAMRRPVKAVWRGGSTASGSRRRRRQTPLGRPYLLVPLCCGPAPLDVQSARVGATSVGNFHPAATNVAPRARRHPDHVFSLFCRPACLRRRHRVPGKTQLCSLI